MGGVGREFSNHLKENDFTLIYQSKVINRLMVEEMARSAIRACAQTNVHAFFDTTRVHPFDK